MESSGGSILTDMTLILSQQPRENLKVKNSRTAKVLHVIHEPVMWNLRRKFSTSHLWFPNSPNNISRPHFEIVGRVKYPKTTCRSPENATFSPLFAARSNNSRL